MCVTRAVLYLLYYYRATLKKTQFKSILNVLERQDRLQPEPHPGRARHIGGLGFKVVAQVGPARDLEVHLQADVPVSGPFEEVL